MIAELVADGITEIDDVKKALRHRTNHYLCKDSPPDPNDRAYFPMHDDLRSHIYIYIYTEQNKLYNIQNMTKKTSDLRSRTGRKLTLMQTSSSVHAALTVTATALLLKVKKVKLMALQLNSHRNTLFSGFISKNGKNTFF